ncbi:MAG: hypothetical protein LC772_06645 [Chloroflexi bacterium]|nr:hypothetical protein [Chloroflexota bacterium]
MRLKITVNNGPFEDVDVLSGSVRQAERITVRRDDRDTVLLVNSVITDDQPDLAICTLLHTGPVVTEPAAEGSPAVAPSESPAVTVEVTGPVVPAAPAAP